MKLYILFGQRKCRYDGQYAPEALAIADEWTMDENPDYIEDEKSKYESSKEFSSLVIIPIEVSSTDINKRLVPDNTFLRGKVV